MLFRYQVKSGPASGSWLVVDKTDGKTLAFFDSRSQARSHAKQMNQLYALEKSLDPNDRMINAVHKEQSKLSA